MTVKLIVDSACDLPSEIINEYDIDVLPFIINIEGETFYDGKDISTEEVYEAMREERYPDTDQVQAETYSRAFAREAEKGNDIIYFGFSSELSGSYQTASLVAEDIRDRYPEVTIDVVDTRSGSAATGIIVYKTARLLEEGVERDALLDRLDDWIGRIEHLFFLDDLSALQRGGRISLTKSLVGNFLNIKPILHLVDGEIKLFRKVRGSKKALTKLVDLFEERCSYISEKLIAITHADDKKKAEQVKEQIEELGGEIFCLELINSVLGVHLGIGGVGIFFLGD